VQVDYRFVPNKKDTYIFVANHFSYLDIAIGMKVVRNYFCYMGKSSVKKVPLLGYMFRKLHIQVDRSDKSSRMRSYKMSLKALHSGRSLFIMPEGGIISKHIPKMHQPFKDGAFALGIETKTPIVPISFLNLYEIMPADRIFWDWPRVIIHPPLSVEGKSVEELKLEVYEIIQAEVDAYRERNHQENS
jgi:1-acyl-sn-glycerol-3-phosphate acyltransferase